MKHKKRNPFECPYDLETCDYVDPTTATLYKDCKECARYGDGTEYKNRTFCSKLKFKRKRAMFECPYDLESCSHVDTAGMDKIMECKECDRYGDGVRPTGGVIDLRNLIKFK